MEMREWLSIIVIIAIVLILLDGFRRKLKERNSVRMKLDKNIPPDDAVDRNSELPNGGARSLPRAGSAPVIRDSRKKTLRRDKSESSANHDLDFGSAVPVLMDSVNLAPDTIESDRDSSRDAGEENAPLDDDEFFGTPSKEPDEEPLDRESELRPDAYADDDELENDELESDEHVDDTDGDEEDGDTLSRSRHDRSSTPQQRIEPSFGDDMDFNEANLDGESFKAEPSDAGRRSTGIKASRTELPMGDLFGKSPAQEEGRPGKKQQKAEAQHAEEPQVAEEVIVINVMAKPGEHLSGSTLLPILMSHGLRLGNMNIFHRHADPGGQGPVMFSMANMVKPGTFDMNTMSEFTTPGVSFFLQLPGKLDHMQSFNRMLDVANAVKGSFNADLKDENRNVITRQTIEHCRQRILDFELKQLVKK
ncbi:MAG: cell division protein ZipA [Pseudomonadales bacterium]|nr:cell division protein ZipA [Pseudomonadales bacterium]